MIKFLIKNKFIGCSILLLLLFCVLWFIYILVCGFKVVDIIFVLDVLESLIVVDFEIEKEFVYNFIK